MRIVAVPNLTDNYAYLVIDEATGTAAVVDPGDAAPVARAARAEGVTIAAVWATHHHPDHVGGVPALLAATPGLAVVCHATDRARDRVPGATRGVDDGDTVTLGGITATIIHNPGHTTGAISYWLADAGAVFTGDTLFGGGCGRVFEGTAAMMHASLTRLAALPVETQVYFGHEYTQANLRFATAVEPDLPALAARVERVAARRAAAAATVPSTIGEERATNPFLRAAVPAVRAAATARTAALGQPAPAVDPDVFAVVRAWKDGFR